VSRIAGNVLAMLTEGERHQVLLDRALQALERWLVAKQGLIEAKFSEASAIRPVDWTVTWSTNFDRES